MLFCHKFKISSLLQIFTNSCNSVLQRCGYRRTQKRNEGLINLRPRTYAAVTLVFTNSHEIFVCSAENLMKIISHRNFRIMEIDFGGIPNFSRLTEQAGKLRNMI